MGAGRRTCRKEEGEHEEGGSVRREGAGGGRGREEGGSVRREGEWRRLKHI